MKLLDIYRDVLTMIVEDLHESYSPFELDQSVYSLALTCRQFYRMCEPLLCSRYNNKDHDIGRVSKFIRMLISRPDRWPDFKFVSIGWDYGWDHRYFGIFLTRDEHIDMLADVPFLKTKIDLLPAELHRLQNRTDGKIREEEKREPHTTYVTDLAEAFKRLLDVGDPQTYATLLVYMFNILSLYIQKLHIKINGSEGISSSFWRSEIFTEANSLKFVSLEELHYVAVDSWESMPREVVATTTLRLEELDILMKIPTLKKLKVDGFAFESEWLYIWVERPRSCAVESLDLMYNFNVKFVQWEIFLAVFKKLKHFSYYGNSRDLNRGGRRRNVASVTRHFLGSLMEGIFLHRNSLESLSLTGIHRSVYDHKYLEISTTPGFTQLFCLKHMKIQLDLLVGVEGNSVGFQLHELLPESLETLELWSQTSIEYMTLTENLSGLMIHKKKFPGFSLREVKFGYAVEKLQVEETWKNNLIKDLGENGIHLMFVGLSREDV
ncbi:hypothetical protein BCIN_12g03010 [Botrytis cinerea B05.10]|uniref:Uncharacterized protein n=2 Tax=Botryotinia fuckeliana TaxID=40559 RepID=A0A384JZD6_BOTFB|nr:hypothetical protein BCIN_12g03010 [Botrytis cinerea B05.10]ATZ55734.1 hypothetical protein BCIN_12g03010 [Botrytis cinerea B05.10]